MACVPCMGSGGESGSPTTTSGSWLGPHYPKNMDIWHVCLAWWVEWRRVITVTIPPECPPVFTIMSICPTGTSPCIGCMWGPSEASWGVSTRAFQPFCCTGNSSPTDTTRKAGWQQHWHSWCVGRLWGDQLLPIKANQSISVYLLLFNNNNNKRKQPPQLEKHQLRCWVFMGRPLTSTACSSCPCLSKHFGPQWIPMVLSRFCQ